ncbi:MAG TPA: hypothetical protein VLH18_01240 [Candidatus Limnocylindrales bacterium]|nr:hypothetical protein [Candidatus Limnocylindrales bacterium]
MLAILTRFAATISGPDAFGAKTSGLIEADFFGQANDNISLVRLGHAFVKLSWAKTDLMIGQYWNPLFVTDAYPTTASINSGTPFNSFARNPQVKLTQKAGDFTFIGAVLSQRDFSSYASNGGTTAAASSSTWLRNASIPDLHFQIHFNKKSESGTAFLAGAGIAYKTIVPRLYARTTPAPAVIEVNEKISGLTTIAFAKLTTSKITIKAQFRYGENLTDVLTPGGYGVTGTTTPGGEELTYSPITINSYWAEIHSNGSKFQVGFFAGLLTNNGTIEELSGTTDTVYGNSMDFARMVRFSPRVAFISNKLKFSFETEYSIAEWGDGTYDFNALPLNKTEVSNIRLLFTSVYTF